MEEEKANPEVIVNENANANSQEDNKGTQEVDYQKKFSESSKEALRLYQENKALREQFELKEKEGQHKVETQNTDSLYPGFDALDEDAKNNLIAYTDTVTKKAKEELYRDPAIAFARKQYAEQKWDSAFSKTVEKYPELVSDKDEFKAKYYNSSNVPENIEEILQDIAKIHLFDKSKEIGARELKEKQNRDELERTTAGAKETRVSRTLGDWQKMAQDNPSKFAKLSKEYHEDLKSGKI